MLAPLWMLALPFIGALGAWLSLRAGGNTRDRLLTALGSAWLNGAIMTLGVPLSMIIERHFSPSIKLTACIVYMIAGCLVPAVLHPHSVSLMSPWPAGDLRTYSPPRVAAAFGTTRNFRRSRRPVSSG